ncbi:GtrA family protein [Actinoplanes sp. NPDC051411]|uniref:GtrA family protein n=1 Tax=Actinoplanes sp. NPDC051411 TaxID=3155522 RepID=UPI003419EF57
MTAAGTLGSVPDTPPTGLRAKLRGLVRELGKFGTVGAISFTIDTVIFNLMLGAGAETLVAKLISTVVATTVAFLGNRFWTWRHRAHTHMARQYTMFFVLNAIGLGIGLGCLAISHYGLGAIWPAFQSRLADNLSAQIVGTAAGTLFRFWSYRRFVFPDTAGPADDGHDLRDDTRAATVTPPSSPLSDSA